jgi:hypothetical protein
MKPWHSGGFGGIRQSRSEKQQEDREMNKPKMITSFVYPPIPVRQFDWCAYRDGCEEDGNYGYGATEEEAIADRLAWEEMNEEETEFKAYDLTDPAQAKVAFEEDLRVITNNPKKDQTK